MKNKQTKTQIFPAARMLLLTALISVFAGITFAQSNVKTISADEIIKQIEMGKIIHYSNVTVKNDFDLSKLTQRTNDAVYPEKDKTARVYSAFIKNPVTFKNVVFSGNVTFFRKEITANEIKEFRLVFADAVKFENCIFEGTTDFELTNFDADISFENSIFKQKPLFIRIGLTKTPVFTGTKFEQGSLFKNFQNDAPQNFSAEELKDFYEKYLQSE